VSILGTLEVLPKGIKPFLTAYILALNGEVLRRVFDNQYCGEGG
jgi:hypothetical protein